LLRLSLETTRDKAIVRIDGAISSLCPAGFIAGLFDTKAPLPEDCLAIGLKPFRCGDARNLLRRLESYEEELRHGVIGLDTADVEAVDATTSDDAFVGAVISGRGQSAVRSKPTSAMAASGNALQLTQKLLCRNAGMGL